MPSFTDLGLAPDLVDALSTRGVTDPFPIQAATIPDALAGRDICGRAPTGSGKTIAFGLPIVERVQPARPRRPSCLILAPTRELAAQIARELEPLADAAWAPCVRGLRRCGLRAAEARPAQGRRDPGRLPGPARGPHRPAGAGARQDRDRGRRRGRPHGRHGLPARGPAPARPDEPRSSDAAVLGDARRRRRGADPRLPDERRPATRSPAWRPTPPTPTTASSA